MFSRVILAIFFIAAGSYHLISPKTYLPLMPEILPWPMALIIISGLAEIAGGIGILISPLRKTAGWGLIALLLAVFPANIHMLTHGAIIGGSPVPHWVLILRLPLQFVMIAWVWWSCLKKSATIADR